MLPKEAREHARPKSACFMSLHIPSLQALDGASTTTGYHPVRTVVVEMVLKMSSHDNIITIKWT